MANWFIEEWQEIVEPNTWHQDFIDHVEEQWREGITKSESTYHAALSLYYCLRRDVESTKAHALAVDASANANDRCNALMSLARIAVHEKDVDGAIKLYRECIDTDPEHDTAAEELGYCLEDKKEYKEAIYWFTRSLGEDGESEWIMEAIGLCHCHLKEYDEAIGWFKKALDTNPDSPRKPELQYCIGLSYQELGDFYRALANYTYALESKPDYLPALNNLGALYYNEEADVETALPYFLKAEQIAMEKNDNQMLTQVYVNLSRLYGRITNYEMHDHYKKKLMDHLGFGGLFEEGDDDEEED